MSDIVDRLKSSARGHQNAEIAWPHRVLHDAKDEIERLREISDQAAFIADAIKAGAGNEVLMASVQTLEYLLASDKEQKDD